MRRFGAVAKATAFEVFSEPLTLLLFLSGLALAVLAPAFHYHQFGEPTRMARDAGFSSVVFSLILIGGFGVLRSIRRECETGTAAMALAHPIGRGTFFLAKVVGALEAVVLLAVAEIACVMTVVNGAAIGGAIADRTGAVARLWGPSLAAAMAVLVLPPILAAVLNRFARFRYVPTTLALSIVCAVLTLVYRFDARLFLALLPVAILAVLPALALIVPAAAFAAYWKANAATSLWLIVSALFLPALGNYYLTDALSRGGSLPWSYVGIAVLVLAPFILAFLVLGMRFFAASRD